nr:NADP-dependent oxidoreductase [Saccharothrix deserti]
MSTKIIQTRFGGPEVLELVEQAPPTPDALAADEVLVRVAFAGVNPIDVMTRTGGGMAAAGVISLPFTPGWDLAGTVEAVGSQVNTLAVGDRVFGMARFPREGAAYAQYAIVPAVDLAPTPDTLTDDAAAALPLAAMTAWQAFADTARVTKGQRVLITGAGGGVGHFAVQIAHHLGATVTAVAGAAKHDWLRGRRPASGSRGRRCPGRHHRRPHRASMARTDHTPRRGESRRSRGRPGLRPRRRGPGPPARRSRPRPGQGRPANMRSTASVRIVGQTQKRALRWSTHGWAVRA